MYTSLSIKNFRAFRSLNVEGLKRVNLFTGRNNSGKTSVLEAVYLLEGEAPAARARQLFRNRGLADAGIVHQTALDMPWATLFRNLAVEEDIEIGGLAQTGPRAVRLSTNINPSERSLLTSARRFVANSRLRDVLVARRSGVGTGEGDMVWIAEDKIEEWSDDVSGRNLMSFLIAGARRDQRDLVSRFGAFEVDRKDRLVLDALRIVEPRLRGLSTILLGGAPILHADLDGIERRLPLAVVGDGMLRLLDIVFAMLQNSRQAVMIDEVENGFHHSVLPMVWKLIHRLAKQYEVQVFAVTHSQECAIAAHEAAKASEYDYQYFRIEQESGEGRAFAFQREVMQAAIDVELEFR